MGYRNKLTEQFYQWEQRGRGWHLFSEPVDLEPVFDPFFGHFAHGEIIDDGARPSWWHTVLSPNRAGSGDTEPLNPNPPEVCAYQSAEHGENVVHAVSIPRNFVANPSAIEHLLTMLALSRQTVSFELIATHDLATMQFVCKPANAYWLATQLKAYLPDCSVIEAHEDKLVALLDEAGALYTADFGLGEEFMRPMATFEGKGHDSYVSLFGIIDTLREGEAVILQTLFCGAVNPWPESITRSVSDGFGGSFFHDAPEMPGVASEKVARPLVGAAVRLLALADTEDRALRLINYSALAVQQASRSPHNALVELAGAGYSLELRLCDIALRQSHRLGMLLNVRELATFAHLPSASISKKLLAGGRATKRAPAFLDDSGYILGINKHQGQESAVGISTQQRTRHVHILGGSGVGKSTLLHSLISQDIEHGRGCCVLDPHGDLIDNVLKSVPKERIADVVLIDPSDTGYPIAFNILSAHSDLERELLASDLVALFRRFSTSWGDNLHSVLANGIMAFLYNAKPGHLGELRRFLIESAYRSQVLATCTDEELQYYWRTEYPLLKTSSIGSILTRLDGFLRPRVIRSMVCQHKGLDFGSLMDGNKIILVKLPQGLIGEENSYLLGACIVAKLQQCAMARQQQSAQERVPFFCYIDEFHHFVTESMGAILSGARKYNFGLVLAHQDMAQVQRHVADIASSLMSNAGTRICFRLSDTDAKRMQEGFNGFSADDLQNLGVGEAIARVNTADADFNLTVLQKDGDFGNREEVIALSRKLYVATVTSNSHVVAEPSTPPASNAQDAIADIPKPQKTPPDSDAPPQKDVQEHRYLQNFIKLTAEQHGYRASIEIPTPDASGQVDVALEKGDERIAVEVSVSTGPDWEMHNIRKCLRAGYTKVAVCSSSENKLQQIRTRIQSSLSPADQTRIVLVTPDQIHTLFSVDEAQQDAVITMKGYRVKVRYDEGGTSKADIIKHIMSARKKAGD